MDDQSFQDLNIFSTYGSAFSLFDLFKQTKVIGGRAEIERMMRNPTNDLSVLISRMEVIRFFKDSSLDLEIDHTQFDLILHYLNGDVRPLRVNPIDVLVSYFSHQIKSSQTYYITITGLNHLLRLFQYSAYLANTLMETEGSTYLKDLGAKITAIFDCPEFQYALTLSSKKKLRFDQVAKLDSIVRSQYKSKVKELLSVFYQLDAFETIAKVIKKKKFCLVNYISENNRVKMEAEGFFHPVINNPVTNSLTINDTNNFILLTGSNMAGKSSLLKSIGLLIYLSHIGFPVPAKSINITVFNGLITTINLSDNIQNGLSHYFSEVIRVKKMAQMLLKDRKIFVIMDELFKGTNAKDAFDASLMVIKGLSEIRNSVFIVSSHITTLVGELKDEKVSFMYLEHLMIAQEPQFTHLLKEGVATDGIGMYFIEKENIFNLIGKARVASIN